MFYLIRYCEVRSPTGEEREIADTLAAELRALGLEVEEDEAASAAEAGAGNLIARSAGTGEEWLMFCAHVDTVPLTPICVSPTPVYCGLCLMIARTRVADCSGVRARSLCGRISPSILIAGGKPAVMNKSDAFFSVTRRRRSCMSLMRLSDG